MLGDISELFDYDIGDNYVGASCDPVVSQADIFGNYAEQVLDIDRNHYFNAGVLVLNINQFREQDILGQFVELLHAYTFVVAQDQDYLNIICKNHVYWIDPKWNSETFGKLACDEEDPEKFIQAVKADRKSTRLNSSHPLSSRMPSSA